MFRGVRNDVWALMVERSIISMFAVLIFSLAEVDFVMAVFLHYEVVVDVVVVVVDEEKR